jgi:signal transduction histidine kinase/CheY-like chemotaxis protein
LWSARRLPIIRGMRLRFHLVALVLVVLVPMIVFAAVVIAGFGEAQRSAVERGALETARALMNAVDENLIGSVRALEALAAAESLRRGDLAAFHAEARRMLTTQESWMTIALLSLDGRQVVNTRRPFGAGLPEVHEPASFDVVVRSRRPAIGDLVFGKVLQEWVLPVRVPVLREGTLVYVLTAGVRPASLVPTLARQRISEDWVIAVFDREKRTVARTRGFEQYLGRLVSPDFVALLDRGGAEGYAVTRTQEGVPVQTAFVRSTVTGWGVGLGIPAATVAAPLRQSLFATIAGGVVVLGIALILAAVVGRRITTPIAALADSAQQLGAGAVLARGTPAGVREVEEVRRAVLDAGALVQQRAAEAESANRAKDEFLAVLSHELRTPLNAIFGWARMLQGGQLGASESTRALDVIVRQANTQLQLIDDLLDVSRVTSGKMRLEVHALDLRTVIEQAVDAVRPAADARDVRLSTRLARVDSVNGDPTRLQQVVWNVLMNAVKFTPAGGHVQVDLRRAGAEVEIVVSDTGAGIAPEVLPFVFDRFRQADSSSTRAHTGLGLGLALVRHLVELHGGTVRAHSEGLGRGATFTLALPLATGESAPDRAARAPALAAWNGMHARGTRLDGLRILIVDDDRDALDLTGTVVVGAGAEARTCASAPEGFAMLQAWKPDVLVSDIEMPGEDGYSLIRRVRALPAAEGGTIPAVALTAYGRAQDRALALNAGYTMHVPKPVDPGELTTILASLAAPQPDRA